MIYPLRRRHRTLIFALSILVPVLFVISLLARQAPPEPNTEIPLSVESMDSGFIASSGEPGTFTAQPSMHYRVLNHQSGQRTAIELSTSEHIRLPELLVYWSPTLNAESLPSDHSLLGSWPVTFTRVFELPERAQGTSGAIILYSLSQQSIVASTPIN